MNNNFKIIVKTANIPPPELKNNGFETWSDPNHPINWVVCAPWWTSTPPQFVTAAVHDDGLAVKLEPTGGPEADVASVNQLIQHPNFLPQIKENDGTNIIKVSFQYKGNIRCSLRTKNHVPLVGIPSPVHLPYAADWSDYSVTGHIKYDWLWAEGILIVLFDNYDIPITQAGWVDNVTVEVINLAGGQDIQKIKKIDPLTRRIEDDLFTFRADGLSFDVINYDADYVHFRPYNFISNLGRIFRLDITTPNNRQYMLFTHPYLCKNIVTGSGDIIRVDAYELSAVLKDKGWRMGSLVWHESSKKWVNSFGTDGNPMYIYLDHLLKNRKFDDFSGNLPDFWVVVDGVTSQYTDSLGDNWCKLGFASPNVTAYMYQDIESWFYDEDVIAFFEVKGYTTNSMQIWGIFVRDETDDTDLANWIVTANPNTLNTVYVPFNAPFGHRIRFIIKLIWWNQQGEFLYVTKAVSRAEGQTDIFRKLVDDLRDKITENEIPIDPENVLINCDLTMDSDSPSVGTSIVIPPEKKLLDWKVMNDNTLYMIFSTEINGDPYYQLAKMGVDDIIWGDTWQPEPGTWGLPDTNGDLSWFWFISFSPHMDEFCVFRRFIRDTDYKSLCSRYSFNADLEVALEQSSYPFDRSSFLYNMRTFRIMDLDTGEFKNIMSYKVNDALYAAKIVNLIQQTYMWNSPNPGGKEWWCKVGVIEDPIQIIQPIINRVNYTWEDQYFADIMKDLCILQNAKWFFSYNTDDETLTVNLLKREASPVNTTNIAEKDIEKLTVGANDIKIDNINTEMIRKEVLKEYLQQKYQEKYNGVIPYNKIKLYNRNGAYDGLDLGGWIKRVAFVKHKDMQINKITEYIDSKVIEIEAM